MIDADEAGKVGWHRDAPCWLTARPLQQYLAMRGALVKVPRVEKGKRASSLPDMIRQSMLRCSVKSFWVYLLANRPRGTLYVGVTNDLVRRTYEHREGVVEGFTKEHGVKMLVYYEQHATAIGAIQREKNIKHWPRKWKIDLIVSMNPDWLDLWEDITR